MGDFSRPNFTDKYNTPPSSINFIAPGKRPLSSMAPAILSTSDGEVLQIIGASGGTRIITSMAYVRTSGYIREF